MDFHVQKYVVDFNEGFLPIARLKRIQVLLALSAKLGWSVHYLGAKSAFLNHKIEENIYVK